MRALLTMLLILMLAIPAAAAPCAPPVAPHGAMTGAHHEKQDAAGAATHGCIGCATPLRATIDAQEQIVAIEPLWFASDPSAVARLRTQPATPPPRRS